MNTTKNQYSPFDMYIEESKQTNLREVIGKYLFHWPLFILFLILSFGTAFLYLHFATPRYTVKARLLIKDEEKGSTSAPALKELNLFKSGAVVENELEVLKSRALMGRIVQDMQLSVQYYMKDNFRTEDLYKERPFKLVMLSPVRAKEPQVIEVTPLGGESFELKQPNSTVTVPFSSTMSSGFGRWQLVPTASLSRYEGKTIKIVVSDPNATVDSYVSRLNAELTDKKSTVVQLSIEENVPERGKDLLNRLIEEYNRAAIDDKNKVRQSTINFIDKRLASLTGELNNVESDVENFKSSRGLTDLSSESKFYLENAKENDSRLNQVNVQLEVINTIERYVNSGDGQMNAPATTGITDPGLAALVNQLITLQLQRNQLLGTAPESSPILDPVNRQIHSVKNSIRENIRAIKSTLIASRNQLQSVNSNVESSIKKLPGQEREFIAIKRQQSIKEELYIYLLQKREEASVSYASTLADSRTVDQAYYGQPESPNPMLCLAFAFISGLLLPIGIISGRELFNNRVTGAKEVQDITEAPILGELVYQKSNSPLVMGDKSRRIIAEQFRSLRTSLQLIFDKKEKGRVTLLTSGMSGEGKSFVSSNLATALATSGRKTLIMECDLRSPMVSKYLNCPTRVGLSDYLNGKVPIEDIVQPASVNENLFVIGAGKIPEYPAELLSRPRMQELIEWVKLNFDEVLIDTPPIRLVADAMILSKFSDVTLYVVRQGFTYKSQLDYVKQLFRDQKLKNLNIVLNGIDIAGSYGNYEYGYYLDKDSNKRLALEAVLKRF